MKFENLRIVWYYGLCVSCGAEGVRSVFPHGEVLPCSECGIGFRMVLGRRILWDNERGERCERFESAVVARPRSKEIENSVEAALLASTDSVETPQGGETTLSAAEMRWLFGYDEGKGPKL